MKMKSPESQHKLSQKFVVLMYHIRDLSETEVYLITRMNH